LIYNVSTLILSINNPEVLLLRHWNNYCLFSVFLVSLPRLKKYPTKHSSIMYSNLET